MFHCSNLGALCVRETKKAHPRLRAVFCALAAARLVSANFNYFCNRRFVFRSDARAGSYFAYWGLVLLVAALSCAGVAGAAALFDLRGGWALTACKIAVETVLFVLSFSLQRTRIFAPRNPPRGME